MESSVTKVTKQAEIKRGGVINPQNNHLHSILTRTILILSKRYESTDIDRKTW